MSPTPKIGFVCEQALGHVTHTDNLRAVIDADVTVDAHWYPIPFAVSGIGAHVPIFNNNWTVRAGLRARRAIRSAQRNVGLDALFIHTQVPAVLSPDWLRKIPSVVSIDATPVQYDQLGEFYLHQPGNSRVEHLKWRANQRCFERADAIVSWSEWAKGSLVSDYGVAPEKVTVIPPGVWYDKWSRVGGEPPDDGVVRILFVGADLERKGGAALLESFRKVRATVAKSANGPRVELHLVTKTAVAAETDLHVYSDMTPNAPALLDLYRRCHIFCLPTRADMLALVLCEAGAAGLPLVSTSVGGIPEIVREGETGLLTPPDDIDALAAALVRLVENPDLRRKLGSGAAATVEARFDARRNAERLVALLRSVATARAH